MQQSLSGSWVLCALFWAGTPLMNLCRASCSKPCSTEGRPGDSASHSKVTHLQIVEFVYHSQVHGVCDPHLLVDCIKCSVQDELVEVLSTILQVCRLFWAL